MAESTPNTQNVSPSQTVRTRFAPSPTGELHVGGARTALFNWAFARHHGGAFVLRIEDTDQKRSSEQSMKNILRDLAWIGLDWAEGPVLPNGDDSVSPVRRVPPSSQSDESLAKATTKTQGDFGPYFQSQRLDHYQAAIDKLLAAGIAYEDDGAVRFKMPGTDVTVDDLILGPVTYPAKELEDFVIRKAAGFPTFHLAHVVDDAAMNVTHVIRGQEHLINTTKHLALFAALELTPPQFAHIPLIFNPDGSKMSKRDKAKVARQAAKDAEVTGADTVEADRFAAFMAKDNHDLDIAVAIADQLGLSLPEIDVADFRAAGYLPDKLCNYLSLLGWNPGDSVEHFNNAFLAKHFDLKRVGKSAGKFDRAKLASFNQDAIMALGSEDFVTQLKVHAPDAFLKLLDDTTWPAFAEAYRERAITLNAPFRDGAFFVADLTDLIFDPNAKAIKKAVFKGEPSGLQCLTEFRPTLDAITPWSGDAVHTAIEAWCAEREVNMGKIAQPIRVAVAGAPVTPPIELTLAILGKQRTLARIDRFLSIATAHA